jgi:FtsP/CotA-like multicopper oxidase with cupredoxin domain
MRRGFVVEQKSWPDTDPLIVEQGKRYRLMKPLYTVHQGRRYRLKFRNASDDIHLLHLHRRSFELTRIAGKSTSAHGKTTVRAFSRSRLRNDSHLNA